MRIVLIEKGGTTIIYENKKEICDSIVDHEESESIYLFISHKKEVKGGYT